MRIEQELRFFPKIYKKSAGSYYMPYIKGSVTNLNNGKRTLYASDFIIDTGASITILNHKFAFLFEDDNNIIDYISVQYGGNNKELPVYKIELKLQGHSFILPAAFDKDMQLTSLLGHFEFLNTFEHIGMSKKRKKISLIS